MKKRFWILTAGLCMGAWMAWGQASGAPAAKELLQKMGVTHGLCAVVGEGRPEAYHGLAEKQPAVDSCHGPARRRLQRLAQGGR